MVVPETAGDSRQLVFHAVLGFDWCRSLGLCSFILCGIFVGAQAAPDPVKGTHVDNAIHKTHSAPHQQLMDKGKEMASLPKEQRAHQWERPRPLPGGEGRRLWAKYEILQGGPRESRVGGRSPRWGYMCRQMSVSQACCNKLPQTGRLKTTNVSSHSSGGQSPRSRGQPGHIPYRDCRGESAPASASFRWYQALLGLWPHPSSLCLRDHPAPSSPLCLL